MANLIDFLQLYGVNVDRSSYKVHLATGAEYPPLDAFLLVHLENGKKIKPKEILSVSTS